MYIMFNEHRLNTYYNLQWIYYSLIVYTNVVDIDSQAGGQAGRQAGG
jgi:hypothetical protein